MTQGRYFPVAGIAIALVTGVVLAFAGANGWLIGATVLIWIGSFWLAVPPPSAAMPEAREGVQLTTSGVRDLIEHSGLPMVLLDGHRIIIANAAAREVMGEHVLGQDPRVAFRHPAAVDLLARPEGGSVTVHGLTGPKST